MTLMTKFMGAAAAMALCQGALSQRLRLEPIQFEAWRRRETLQIDRRQAEGCAPGTVLIDHAGLVVEVEEDEVKFIHSTTSRGVIVSSLREGYWNYSFVKATRIF